MARQVERNHPVPVPEKIATRQPCFCRRAETVDEDQWPTDARGVNMDVHAFLSSCSTEPSRLFEPPAAALWRADTPEEEVCQLITNHIGVGIVARRKPAD